MLANAPCQSTNVLTDHAAFASKLAPTLDRVHSMAESRHFPFFSHPVWIIPRPPASSRPICAITLSLNFWNASLDGHSTAAHAQTCPPFALCPALVFLAVAGRSPPPMAWRLPCIGMTVACSGCWSVLKARPSAGERLAAGLPCGDRRQVAAGHGEGRGFGPGLRSADQNPVFGDGQKPVPGRADACRAMCCAKCRWWAGAIRKA